jgi:hypothetical protein
MKSKDGQFFGVRVRGVTANKWQEAAVASSQHAAAKAAQAAFTKAVDREWSKRR